MQIEIPPDYVCLEAVKNKRKKKEGKENVVKWANSNDESRDEMNLKRKMVYQIQEATSL